MNKESKLSAVWVRQQLPKRSVDTYKGKQGHVLVIAGSRGMSGAAYLAGLGALRGGAGLVTVATPASVQPIIAQRLPEALTLPLPESSEGILNEHALSVLETYVNARSVTGIALGPGLAIHTAVGQVVKSILKNWDLPLVLDADGLNNVSPDDLQGYPKLIITPHAIELSRLLGVDREVVKRNRARVAQNMAHDRTLVCVLKGYQTVITDGKTTRINPTGNPAMAAGGMGDVLTGLMAALVSQGLPLFEAASVSVYLHGLAGDLARVSDRGLLAHEVADALPLAYKRLGLR